MDFLTTPTLRIWCLGDLELSLEGGPRQQPRPKVSELFALLLLAQGKPTLRPELEEGLWPDTGGEARKASLRTHLTYLRTSLGVQKARLASEGGTLSFDMTGVAVDALRFREALQRAKQTGEIAPIEQALSLYTGPLLPFSGVRAIRKERDRLQGLYFQEVDTLAEKLVAQEQHEQAVAWLRRALAIDPLHEKTIGFLLRLLENDIAQVHQVMATYRRALEKAPDHSPAAHLEARYEQICAQQKYQSSPPSASVEIPTAPRPQRPHRLPIPSQSLLGREEEIERIRTRLTQSPFVTLVGVGGVGKSRLAIEVAWQSRTAYRDGVVYVDLARLPQETSQESVAEAIAVSLEIAGEASSFAEALGSFLEGQHLLLVLDNCEHVAVACLGLIRVLRKRCKHLTLLVTSRKQFSRNYGEVIQIPSLPLPALHPQRPLSLEALRDLAAVQLFEKTLKRRYPEFEVTPKNRETVIRICQATDGLPLAIQLLASGVSQDLSEPFLEDLSAIKIPEDLTVPERSRTMFRSLAWSCQMLSEAERDLFYRIALFAGEWTTAAAEAICREPEQDAARITPLLEQLRAASLVEYHERSEGDRYSLLKPVKEYAVSGLKQTALYHSIARRHLDYYLEQVENLSRLQEGAVQQQALRTLTEDLENLYAALDYALQNGQSEQALRLTAALARYWYMNGRLKEGQAWLDRVLLLSPEAPIALRRRVLHGAGTIAYMREDLPRARALWSEALKLCHEMNDPVMILQTQGNLGNVALSEEDFPAAKVCFEACLQAHKERKDSQGIARTLANLALVANGEGDYPLACSLHAESLSLFRAQKDIRNLLLGLINLADVLILLKQYREAHAALAECLDLCFAHENPRNLAHCLTHYVMLAAAEGLPERAALLMGVEENVRATSESPLPDRAQTHNRQIRCQLIERLGDILFAALLHVGAQTDLSTMHTYAKSSGRSQGR